METPSELYDMCRKYACDESGTLGPLLLKIIGAIRSRDIKALCTCSELVDWHSASVDVVRVLLQIEAFFKKNESLADSSVCLEAAKASFFSSEELCKQTNDRLDRAYLETGSFDPVLQVRLRRAESYIRRVLGPLHNMIEAIPRHVKFTNGATYDTARRNSHAYRKVHMKSCCTPRARPYLQSLRRYFGYGVGRDKMSIRNRVEVVPKNWKTHRTIACEPAGNIPFQLAVDGYVKSRLQRWGIDLSDQFRNQELARISSIDGSFATLDLSAASDTVAINTVAWLFPSDWFSFLSDLRSAGFSGVFGEGRYHKFSSMGNGYTFVLETLIFAALCYSVGSSKFSVYGDDIIIETEYVDALKEMLSFFGFQLNLEKSYSSGPFRESCGGNFFNGINVTPFYVRSLPRSRADQCHVVNGLVQISKPWGALWKLLRTYVRKQDLPLIPWSENSGSGVWIDIHTSYAKKLIRANENQEVQVQAFIPKRRGRFVRDSRTLFLWHLDKFQGRVFNETVSWNPIWADHLNTKRSWVPILSHGYVRKWVSWRPPAGTAPLSLYGWADYVTT